MLTHENAAHATTARTRLVTHPNGGTRVQVTVNGRTKRTQFDHSASDAHTAALVEATGIAAERFVEISRTLNGRAWHIEPAMSEAYSDGVDTYDRYFLPLVYGRAGKPIRAIQPSAEEIRAVAKTVFDMIESEDCVQLMRDYDRQLSELSTPTDHRDAFLSVLADVTE